MRRPGHLASIGATRPKLLRPTQTGGAAVVRPAKLALRGL
jgi:hypothetical protein